MGINFEEAWQIRDNQRIIRKVLSKFKINKEDGLQCGRIALFKALQQFDINKNVKFTSYLYNWVRWEILNFLNEDKKKIYGKLKRHSINDNLIIIEDFFEDFLEEDYINYIIGMLPESEGKLVKQRFFERLTLKEIAQQNNYSLETARKKINIILNKINYIRGKNGKLARRNSRTSQVFFRKNSYDS